MLHVRHVFRCSFRHRARVWLLLVGSLLLFTGCDSVRFGYNHADTFLVASLDRYLDLESEQKQLLKTRAETLLTWHRATQLNAYSALLEEARARIREPVTGDEVLAFQRKLMDRLAAIGERAAPDIAKLALTLTPEQLGHLRGELADDAEEFREKYGSDSPDGIAATQAKRFRKNARFWLGDLTREQQDIVRTGFAGRDELNRFWTEERERRRRDLLATLTRIQKERPAVAVAAGWVREYFAGFERQADPSRQAAALALRRSSADLIARLLNAATPEQRATLGEKLGRYAEDFTVLAAEGGRYVPAND